MFHVEVLCGPGLEVGGGGEDVCSRVGFVADCFLLLDVNYSLCTGSGDNSQYRRYGGGCTGSLRFVFCLDIGEDGLVALVDEVEAAAMAAG